MLYTEKERNDFGIAARTLTERGAANVADLDANCNLACKRLLDRAQDFTLENFIKILSLGLVDGLIPSPNAAALREAYRAQLVANYNAAISDPGNREQVKIMYREEVADRRTQARHEQLSQQIHGRELMDAQQGFPPLPTLNQHGQAIDAAFLKNLDGPTYKLYVRKHGFANLTARLNGVR
jgi:hypothetical protein